MSENCGKGVNFFLDLVNKTEFVQYLESELGIKSKEQWGNVNEQRLKELTIPSGWG